MNALKIHLQKSTLFREQDGTESFFPSNAEVFFFVKVCVCPGGMLRTKAWNWDLWYFIALCGGYTGFFWHHQPAALKSNKNMWHKRLIFTGHSLLESFCRFSAFCHGVTSATSVWSGSCAVYTSDGIFGAAPWLHQVLGVIRSTFMDSPFAVTVTWFWMISTNYISGWRKFCRFPLNIFRNT